jgi:hypothetical protein
MQQVFPAPRFPRALFELFALHVPGQGIESILDLVDFAGVNEAAIWAAFGHKIGQQSQRAGYVPRLHLHYMLHSPDFHERARQLLLNAYPGKRRAIFVHIPKCAGTDMTALLRRHYPTLQKAAFDPTVPAADLFTTLRDTVLGLRYSDTIALTGHERLAFYHRQFSLVRPQDWVFTIVRDPRAMLYSHLCYILTVCRDAPRTGRPDGLLWLKLLDLKAIPEHASAAYLADLARALLAREDITPRNTLCNFLGDGTANSALEAIIASNIEITDTARYPAWRAEKFPHAAASHVNPSHPYFTPDQAEAADLDRIAELTAEDRLLYAAIAAAFARNDQLSIRGRQLK